MSSGGNDPFSAFTRLWTESAAQAMQTWFPTPGTTESPEMFRKGRADLLQMWSDWSEQLLRSKAFLEAQQQMLAGNLGMRKQFREGLRRMQRDLQLAGREDIDALAAAIRRSETRVLDQLEETSALLRSLETKVNRLSRRLKKPGSGKITDGKTPGGKNGGTEPTSNGARKKRRPAAEKE